MIQENLITSTRRPYYWNTAGQLSASKAESGSQFYIWECVYRSQWVLTHTWKQFFKTHRRSRWSCAKSHKLPRVLSFDWETFESKDKKKEKARSMKIQYNIDAIMRIGARWEHVRHWFIVTQGRMHRQVKRQPKWIFYISISFFYPRPCRINLVVVCLHPIYMYIYV